jgi:hypothetical protein
VLLRLPRPVAVLVGLATTYWSWCLAMYRDVEQPLGVLDPVLHISLEGVRLPWFTTLTQMGYLPSGASPLLLLVLCAAFVGALWWVRGTPPSDAPAAVEQSRRRPVQGGHLT